VVAAATEPTEATKSNANTRLRLVGDFIRANERPLKAAATLLRGALTESRVAGGSMGTSVPDGAVIQIAMAAEPMKRGDVVAFLAADKTLVHRVRWRGHMPSARNWLLTQGDALVLPDAPVKGDAVLGRVEAVLTAAQRRQPTHQFHLPRRDRALSLLVFACSVVLLEIHPHLARWLIERLRGLEYRKNWTEALLYGRTPRPSTDPPRPPRGSALALTIATACCRLGAWARRMPGATQGRRMRWWESAQRVLGAVCTEALSREEKSQLTVRIYDFFPGYYRTITDQLHPWEGPWFERRLPVPPASVLVGASGVGREAVVLAQRGYRIDALEPAPDFVAISQRALGDGTPVYPLSYEDLNTLLLDPPAPGQEPAQHELQNVRYDAILLGSGSLTHVLDPLQQQRLMQACTRLCPTGPILASFFCDDDAGSKTRVGAATRMGRRIGRALAALRGKPLEGTDRLSYRPHSGFAYTFTPQQVEALASCVGRTVTWEPGTSGGFRCVTLLASG